MTEEELNRRAERIGAVIGFVVFRAIWFLVWFSLPFVAANR